MKLYKFRTVDKYSLIGLLNNNFWFSALSYFNDPFEGKYIFDDYVSPENLKKLIPQINPDNTPNKIKILKELGVIDGGKNKKSLCLKLINRDFKHSFVGVIHKSKALCLSYFDETEDKPDPLYENLMWSHYADGLRGFCMVFDGKGVVNGLINRKLKIRPNFVKYIDTPIVLKLNDYVKSYIIDNDGEKAIEAATETITSKSLSWVYENELRLLSLETESLINYSPETVIEVVIGEKMPVDEQKQVILNARTANPAVTIKTARLKPNTYQLEIIDYIEPKNN